MYYNVPMRLVGVLVAVVLTVPFAVASGDATPVVLVTVDTLRADRVGLKPSLTPSLDALAREGVRFTQAMVQVPITLPSHASILTGTHPVFHGLRDFVGIRLKEEKETLTEILKARGYVTAAFVSSFALDSSWGLDQGFDVYHDHFDLSRYKGVGFNAVERRGDETVDLVLDWLSRRPPGPLFLWVHLFDPHDPYDPPEPFRSRYRNRPYDGEVAFADAQLGRLLEGLKKAGLYQEALIVVMGDHGEGLGEHQEETHGFFVYNSTLHIPLVMKLPKGEFSGTRVEALVQSVDVAPTILQVLRLPRGEQMQGRGLLGLIRNPQRGPTVPAYGESMYARYHFGWSSLTAFQDGRYKFIRAPRKELYDLQADPGETRNLYGEMSSLAHQYENQLLQLMEKFSGGEGEEGTQVEVDPETQQRLQSLGYVAISAGLRRDQEEEGLPDPKDKILLFNQIRQATLESEEGRFPASIRRLNQVIAQDPQIYTARYLQGFNFFQTGQFVRAVDEFKQALKLFPDSPHAIHSLAMSYFNLGMLEEAEAGFDHLERLLPGDYRVPLGRAHVALKRKESARALELYRQSLSRRESSEARLGLGQALLADGQLDAGISELQAYLQKYPAIPQVHLLLAYGYEKKGSPEEARKHRELARRLGGAGPGQPH